MMKNMTKAIKFVYIMILFLPPILVGAGEIRKLFFTLFKKKSYLIHNLSFPFINTFFLSFLIYTIAYHQCKFDMECMLMKCVPGKVNVCSLGRCYCVNS